MRTDLGCFRQKSFIRPFDTFQPCLKGKRTNCYKNNKTKQQLEARGFAVLDSRSNFLFASTDKKSGGELYLKLKEKGVLVRHFDAPRISNWLRITIGTPDDMTALLRALDEILEG